MNKLRTALESLLKQVNPKASPEMADAYWQAVNALNETVAPTVGVKHRPTVVFTESGNPKRPIRATVYTDEGEFSDTAPYRSRALNGVLQRMLGDRLRYSGDRS